LVFYLTVVEDQMINVTIPQLDADLKPRITVFGVGGAGGNAVNNMIKSNLEGVDFVIGNTDAQALKGSLCDRRLQLGANLTRGLGAGSKPDVGRAAAEEQMDEIVSYLDNSNMVFITAGMGGGTGTGAAPVIARAARERNILTVGVVTKPFHFEGAHRMRLAESGIAELQQYVDTLIIIPNQNLFRIANEKTTFADAFKMADDVLHSGVRGVTDLMVMPGLINLDFADIRSVMTEMGKAMMGTGEASGDRRAIEAAEAAISNPLLDDVSMKGARGVLINITGGYDMTLFEVDEAAHRVREEVDPDANIIFGSTFDPSMEGVMRVSVVATGIESASMTMTRPANPPSLSLVSDRVQPPAGGGLTRKPTTVPGLTAAAPARAAEPAPQPHHVQQPQHAPMAATASAAPQPAPLPLTMPAAVAPQAPVASQPSYGQAPMTHGSAAVQMEPQPVVPTPAPQSYQTAAPQAHQVAAPQTHQVAAPQQGDRFIAPRPMDGGPRATFAAPPAAQPTQDAPEAQVRRRLSLFERVTGIGRRREEPAPAPVAPPAPQQRAPQAPTYAEPPQHHGMQPSAGVKPAPASAEDDHLDIPAFLRRQAN
jgi:cell division protein FtsZ